MDPTGLFFYSECFSAKMSGMEFPHIHELPDLSLRCTKCVALRRILNIIAVWKCSTEEHARLCVRQKRNILRVASSRLLIRFQIRKKISAAKQGIKQMVNYQSLFSPVWLAAGWRSDERKRLGVDDQVLAVGGWCGVRFPCVGSRRVWTRVTAE